MKRPMRTGYVYMLVAHIGAALILVAFLITLLQDFQFRFWILAAVLAFFRSERFGLSAGFYRFWSEGWDGSTALLGARSIRCSPRPYLCLDGECDEENCHIRFSYGYASILLGQSAGGGDLLSWSLVSFPLIIGAFYALTEKDLKRLLAYSSVENVGIILMGCGMGMIGISIQQPVISVLGFLAALYHMLNHAFFKGLLYLGAGSVITQVGSRNLNQWAALARRMPWTALSFLIGALAVTAIPPFNGFVSEWFTYQAFFTASQSPFPALRVFAPLSAVLLALAGAFRCNGIYQGIQWCIQRTGANKDGSRSAKNRPPG